MKSSSNIIQSWNRGFIESMVTEQLMAGVIVKDLWTIDLISKWNIDGTERLRKEFLLKQNSNNSGKFWTSYKKEIIFEAKIQNWVLIWSDLSTEKPDISIRKIAVNINNWTKATKSKFSSIFSRILWIIN